MNTTNTIIFTGGGTGGHIYPNLALIPEFVKRGFKVAYIGGTGKPMERRLAEEQGIKYYGVPTIKLVRSLSLSAIKNNIKIPFTLSGAVNEASELLKKLKPAAVFSKGGFVSLPIVIASKKLKIPVFAHESDLTLGLANKIAKQCGATLLKANPHARFDGIEVGMPLRADLFGVDKTSAKSRLGILTSRKILLVLGGSSGAKFLNDEVEKHIKELTQKYFVLHVSGRGGISEKQTDRKSSVDSRKNYLRFDYADNIADFYAASDLVISRAGATAVYEISALKKRAIFVPLPKGVSRGDQIFNAELAEEYGGITLCQNESFSDNFLRTIENALQNPPMRAISADANGKIADLICDSIRRGEKCKDKKPSQNGLR
ncbi:MAG: UDP-N-acetylglucosamine--N-acetylmuramyl-(pentapeptide) pyrophosphoryl-undecaprenol N-acetylglucosamine transferase [Bacteroides sp.]|nr:UDP-N-acetylglucosamine--N-acetylmuramyl-(pentapeptide) pyrophosphoryl-undecaprenol N-acetylglucosamine transferase [Bacillota bacterium]MCM1393901.1 UDP-N-acetylglucosamine--N-acetylmuramyl-(pentapeptide) pyrophosphoryl-undecaprenol N-acetylglucosamine transferase [[Eubacterium] siraeum]MCM1455321.1 UDP-N-acetylglucosamine--N-acetylmuramyl-(pentapeptide) pyrophosphoryl-undecaprenol N-acetylglucosamine transferase [Bacteroides sp.]